MVCAGGAAGIRQTRMVESIEAEKIRDRKGATANEVTGAVCPLNVV